MRHRSFLFLLLLVSFSAYGQGSFTSLDFYGPGVITPFANAREQGLGGIGMHESNPFFLGDGNPAFLGANKLWLVQSTISGQHTVNRAQNRQEINTFTYSREFWASGLNLNVVIPTWFGSFQFSKKPNYRMRYDNTVTFGLPTEQKHRYTGVGGGSEYSVGYGVIVMPEEDNLLSLGVRFLYNTIGSVREVNSTFEGDSFIHRVTDSTKLNGPGLEVGALYSFRSYGIPDTHTTFDVYYRHAFKHKLTFQHTHILESTPFFQDVVLTDTTLEACIPMPSQLGAGVSIHRRYDKDHPWHVKFTTEYILADRWDDLFTGQDSILQNYWIFRLGSEAFPWKGNEAQNNKLGLRVGGYWIPRSATVFREARWSEYQVGLGMTTPWPFTAKSRFGQRTAMNISVTYTWRDYPQSYDIRQSYTIGLHVGLLFHSSVFTWEVHEP